MIIKNITKLNDKELYEIAGGLTSVSWEIGNRKVDAICASAGLGLASLVFFSLSIAFGANIIRNKKNNLI